MPVPALAPVWCSLLLPLCALIPGDPPLSLPPAHTQQQQQQYHTQQQQQQTAPEFSWVPIVPNTRNDYYRVKLARISLGGERLPVPGSVFDQGHGTILDSGTTYLCVPTPVRQVGGVDLVCVCVGGYP